MVEHLEADLGVQVEELRIPQLKYSFQIWGAMMSSPGKDGKVCLCCVVCALCHCSLAKRGPIMLRVVSVSGPDYLNTISDLKTQFYPVI